MIIDVCLFATLLAISVVDLRSRRIPDALSLPLVAAGLALAVAKVIGGAPVFVLTDSVIGAASGYLVFAAIGTAFYRLRHREGLGLGDAKLLAAAGAWTGWQYLPEIVLVAAVGGLVQVSLTTVLARGKAKDPSLAFGPWLAAGFFLCWMMSSFEQP